MVKIYIDERDNGEEKVQIFPRSLIMLSDINTKNQLEYIQGSNTFDTLRYGHRGGYANNLPFVTVFTDKNNVKWEVWIENQNDTVNFCIPCGRQMLWYGADENPTRTGSDTQTDWCEVQFSFQDRTWLPPYHAGIRVAFNGYKDRDKREWAIDTQRWNEILGFAGGCLGITGEIITQAGKVSVLANGVPI